MLKLVILAHIFYIALSYRGNFIASYWLGIKLVGNYSSRQEINWKQQCTCVLIKCCLTLWCKCECSKRLEAGQERSERTARASYVNWTVLRTTTRGTESVHWYSSIWPADNGDVTGVKTAVPLRIVLARKARGPCMVVMVSKWVQQPYVTLMWALSRLLPRFPFFSLTFCAVSPRGLPKRAFCTLTMPGMS